MKKESQIKQVLAYLKKHKQINRDEAYALWKVRRLGAIIFMLREDGWKITTTRITNGVALYTLTSMKKLSIIQRVEKIHKRNNYYGR